MIQLTKEKQRKMDCAIAYFMGWRIDNSYPDKDKVWKKGANIELDTTFKFLTDWNALMQVYNSVNKLEGYKIIITGTYCEILKFGELAWQTYDPSQELQENIYTCLGEFIMSFNEEQLRKNNEG